MKRYTLLERIGVDMEEEVRKCRWCKKVLERDYDPGEEPPWLWERYYCSEGCEKGYIKTLLVRLLEEVEFFLDEDVSEKGMRKCVSFCKGKLYYEA